MKIGKITAQLVVSIIVFIILATGFTIFSILPSHHPIPFYTSVNSFNQTSSSEIDPSDEVQQSLQAWRNGLSGLDFNVVSAGEGEQTLRLRLLDAKKKELRRADYSLAELPPDGVLFWAFERLPDSAGQQYYLSITNVSDGPQTAIAVRLSNMTMSPMTSFWQNGQLVEGTMTMGSRYLLGVEFLPTAGGFLLCALLALLTGYWNPFRGWLQKQRLELVLLAIGLPFGMCLVVAQPPLHLFDEDVHFPTAYQVSQGQLYGEASHLVPEYIAQGRAKTFRSVEGKTQNPMMLQEWLADRPVSNQPDTARSAKTQYSFISYLPSAIFIWLGILFHGSYLSLIYLARFGNLLFYLTLCALAIRVAPAGKSMFFLLALLPIPFTQGLCIGVDSMNNSASYLFIALVLRLAMDKSIERISWKCCAIVLLTGLLAISSKFVYATILSSIFLIPIEKFGGWRRFVGMLAIALSLCGIYLAFMLRISHAGSDMRAAGDVDFQRQMNFLLQDPIQVMQVTWTTIYSGISSWGNQFSYLSGTGLPMGLLSFLQPFLFGYYAVHATGYPGDGHQELQALAVGRRAWLALLFVLTFPLIVLPLYLSFTPVGATQAAGVQERYFLPILPLLLFALIPLREKEPAYHLQRANMILVCVAMLWVNVTLVARTFY